MMRLPAVLALSALLPAAALAAGPKASGSVSVKDDLLTGSGGGAAMTAGSSRLSGSFGQGGPIFVIGSTQARGGYMGPGLVPPDPAGSLSAAQNQAVRTSSVSWTGLSWTSPGENGAAGNIQAGAFYDVRRATFPLTSQAAWDAAPFRSTFSAAGPGLSPASKLLAAEPGRNWYFGHTTVNSGGMRSDRVSASAWAQGLRVITEDVAGAQALQGQTTAFLKIRLWVDQGASLNWRTLTVGKAGTLPDAAVQNVGVYRDNNANGVFDGGDPILTAPAAFSSSRAAISLSGGSGETVGASTQAYFVAATIAPGYLPVAGATVALFLDGMPFGLEKGGERGPDRPGLSLDGNDDYVSLAYDASLNIASALTVECWVRSTAPVAGAAVLLDRESGATGYSLTLQDGIAQFYPGGAGGSLSAGVRVDDGAWHHVAAVYEGGGNQRIYVDGLLMSSRVDAGALGNASSGLSVGADEAGISGFPGAVDEVRVSKTARYSSAFIPQRRFASDANTVVLHHFDASDPAGTALDSSAEANHGTLQGGAAFHARSSPAAVPDSQDVLYSSVTDLMPAVLYRGQADVPVLAIRLWTGGDFATLDQLFLERTGTGADADVGSARVYFDDGDGVFEPGQDEDLVGNKFFAGGKSTFNFLAAGKTQTIGTSTRTYFAVWDIAGAAGVGNTLGLRIGATVEFLLSGATDTVSQAGLPFAGGPGTVYAAGGDVAALFASTGSWTNAAEVVFEAAFGLENASYYRYAWNQAATYDVTGGDTQWSSGRATMTAASDGDWRFHARSYDAIGEPGMQWDLGPFRLDRTAPSASAFAALSSTGGWLAEGQWTGLAAGASARMSVQDLLAGLAVSTGALTFRGDGHDGPGASAGFGVLASTTAGASWTDGAWEAAYASGDERWQSLAVFGGKLYAGTGVAGRILSSADGISWGVAYDSAEQYVFSLAVFNGRLYAGTSPGGKILSSADGSSWSESAPFAGESAVYGLAAAGDKLYAATYPGGQIHSSPDGTAWTKVYDSAATDSVFGPVEFNGKLYAGTYDGGKILASEDGANWDVAFDSSESGIRSLAVFNNKLYAGSKDSGRVLSSDDGAAWTPAYVPAAGTVVESMAVFGGRLYMGTTGGIHASRNGTSWAKVFSVDSGHSLAAFNGKLYAGADDYNIYRLTPLAASLTGADGSTAWETLSAASLDLPASTNSLTCGGISPCGATNQVVFTVTDMAGNVTASGPWAVLVDTTPPPQPLMTSLTPAAGETVFAAASGLDALSGVEAWSFRASTAADFTGTVSSSDWQGAAAWTFAGLTPGDTWYVRAESRDRALNVSAPSVAFSTWVWGAVQVSTADLAPGVLQQGGQAAFLRLTLKTSPGRSTTFRTLRAARLGTAPDGDVAAVRLYEDTAADGSFDPGGDTLRASGVFASGEVLLDLGGTAQTIASAGKTFFVVYEAAPQAAAGGTLGARVAQAADAGVDYPYWASGPFPSDSGLAAIGDGPNDLNVTPESLASAIVQPGSADLGLLKLTAAAGLGGVSVLKEAVLYLDGTLASNKVSALKVWRDGNGNGTLEPGSDWLLSSGADLFASRVATVAFTAVQSSRTVYDAPSARLFVSVSLTADAPAGSTFSVRVATPSEFRLDTPQDAVVFSILPMASGASEVQLANNLTVTLADLAPAELFQGLAYAVLRASLTVDAGQAKVNRVTVNRAGAGADADVSAVKVYLDAVADGQGWDPVGDSLRGQAAFSGGSAAVDITTVTLNAGATSALFIVYELAASANPGDTLGAGMSNVTYVRAASLYTTVAGNFPFSSSNGTVKATVNTLSASPLNQAPGSLLQGATNVALLRLRVRSDKNPISWTSIALQRLGTLGDAGVSGVKIFRDENGNGTFQYGTDTLVTSGADAFSAGSAALGFTSAQSVTTSDKDYFVAVDVSPSAAPGATLGVRVDTTTAFGVNSPNRVSTGPPSYPFDAGPVPVAEYADTVYVATASLAPSGADPGEANVPMMSLLLNTDVSDAGWLSLKVDRAGAGADADVKAVKVYCDASTLGTFDPAQPGNYLLVTSDTMTFGSQGTAGTVNLALSPVQSLNAAAKRYFVVLDVSTNAAPGNTVAVRALDKTYFSVQAPNNMADAAFESGAAAVSAPPRKLYMLSYASAPASALQGAINVPMLSLSVWMEQYSAQVTGLSVARTGTGSDADVGKVRLYRDDGDGELDPSFDAQLATAAFSGGYANLAFAAETVTTSTATWFLAFDLAQTAGAGGTVGASIGTPGSVNVGSPHSAASQGFPHQSGLMQVNPTQSGIYASFQDKAPAQLSQEAAAQLMLSLAMNTTANAALLTSVEVEPLGTAAASDVDRLRVYLDDGDSVFEPGADQELASLASPFAAGPAVAGLSPSQEVGTSARRFWVAVDMARFADPSKTFGLRVASAASLSVVAPDYAVDSGFPMESSIAPISKVPDTLNILPAALLTQDAIQGSTVAAARLQAWASRQQLTWTRLKLRKSGSLADAHVKAAVYRDDGDGSLDSGDVLIGTAAFSGGLATVIFSSAQTVGTSTGTYFAALALDFSATVGATVGAALDDAGFFTVVSPDGVSASGLPLNTSLVSVLDAKTPTQPQVVLPDGPAYHSFESIRFTWNSTVAQGGISSAQYCVGATAGGSQTLGWTAFSPGQSEVTISGLTLANGSTYYVSVRATSSFGYTSPTGTSGSRLVDFQEPAKPVVTAQAGETAVIVNWTNVAGGPSGIKGYLVEYRRIESPVWRNAKTGAAALASLGVSAAGGYKTASVPDEDLVNPPYAAGGLEKGTLFFRIRAVSGAGSIGDPSDPVKVQYGPLPKDGINDVSAYPNPFDSRKQEVNIAYTLSADASVEIKIFDVFGRKVNVLSFGAGSNGGLAGTNVVSWNGTDDSGRKVSMGAYIAVIRSGGAKVVHKIGVIH